MFCLIPHVSQQSHLGRVPPIFASFQRMLCPLTEIATDIREVSTLQRSGGGAPVGTLSPINISRTKGSLKYVLSTHREDHLWCDCVLTALELRRVQLFCHLLVIVIPCIHVRHCYSSIWARVFPNAFPSLRMTPHPSSDTTGPAIIYIILQTKKLQQQGIKIMIYDI